MSRQVHVIFFARSAFKHGITHEQIDDVLRSTYSEVFDEGFDRTGHYSAMYVGFDSQGNLIEVMVKFIEVSIGCEGYVRVFHADKATKKYCYLFTQRKQK